MERDLLRLEPQFRPARDQAFERQPRLFEAEHAFHFGLLDEQQALKETYRASRRETGPATPATR